MKTKQTVYHSVDIINKISELEKEYGEVFWTHIDGELYVYKALGRRDYKEIYENEELSDIDKEDEIVKKSILIPEDLDIDECSAGVISELARIILDISYLSSSDGIIKLMNYYRSEMFSLANQITCMINEAFPNFDIREIENWDMDKTAYYLSRAEWKLQNFRDMQFGEEYFKIFYPDDADSQGEVIKETQTQNVEQKQVASSEGVKSSDEKRRLTPEKLRELKMKMPEIDWENAQGLDDNEVNKVDTLPVALRPMG